jgi:MoxR-like ATPase
MTYQDYTGKKAPFYEANSEVVQTVNLAIKLGRPILVEGEAGCGKTQLASAISHELELGSPVSITVKSTSQAKDLLYRFDALRRLQDIQDPNNRLSRSIHPYISLQPLGHAIFQGRPCVVLIDEVDKADIDFPNDLLQVLEKFTFDIDDLPSDEDAASQAHNGFGRTVVSATGVRPIVVITSNREKQLPEPFLRRCLYAWLSFPNDQEMLGRIITMNIGSTGPEISKELVTSAVSGFLKVRRASEDLGVQKRPATSELIDWVKALHWQGVSAGDVGSGGLRPPSWWLLFKTMQDLEAYDRKARAEEARDKDDRE